MLDQFSRTQPLLGVPTMERLRAPHVTILGLGGVGGHVVETLARSNIGALDLIDDNKVCLTGLNRQVLTLCSTIGKYKVEVATARVAEIDPGCRVTVHRMFYLPGTADHLDFRDYNYVVDATDTVTGEIQLILQARGTNTKIISCMGADNKLNPTEFVIADVCKTSVDPLVRVMRRELKKRGVWKYKMVYSTETPVRPSGDPSISCRNHRMYPLGTERKYTGCRDTPGNTVFAPTIAGPILTGEMMRGLAGKREA